MFTSHSLAATHPRNAQWDLLSRARAVEYSSYLIASQFWGESHFGHSRVIDPYGKLLSDRPKGDGIVWAELSNDLLNDAKQDLESSPAAAGEK
jgi:nitrilase